MTSTLRGVGGGGQGKNEMLSDVVGWGVRECSGRPVFIFFLLKNIGLVLWPDIMLSHTLMHY